MLVGLGRPKYHAAVRLRRTMMDELAVCATCGALCGQTIVCPTGEVCPSCARTVYWFPPVPVLVPAEEPAAA